MAQAPVWQAQGSEFDFWFKKKKEKGEHLFRVEKTVKNIDDAVDDTPVTFFSIKNILDI